MSDDYDDYLNADESDFDTDDEDSSSEAFGDGIEEEPKKPKKKKAARARRPKAARPKKAPRKKKPAAKKPVEAEAEEEETQEAVEEVTAEEVVEEIPKPPTDHVVHLYMVGKFSRTIDRPFTAEDAEAFASSYNKSAKVYGQFAVTGKESAKPAKSIPWREGIAS